MRCKATIAGAILATCTVGATASMTMIQGIEPGAHLSLGSTDDLAPADLIPGGNPSAPRFGIPLRDPSSIQRTSVAAGSGESFSKKSGTLFSYSGIITGGRNQSVSVDKSEVSNDADPTAVTEPKTYALLLAGLAAVGFIARRRKED